MSRNLEFTPMIEGEFVNTTTLTLVRNAGLRALTVRTEGLSAKVKSSKDDIVTSGDTAVSEVLRDGLGNLFSGITFIDEEVSDTHAYTINHNQVGMFAVIDPIDGTGNYFAGNENWGVSVGFARDGEIVGGIIYHPEVNRIYYAERGRGAFVNDTRLKVSDVEHFEGCAPIFDMPYESEREEWEQTEAILALLKELKTQKPLKLGSKVVETMRIADGEKDFFFHLRASSWDVAAAISIVTEAGGKVTNVRGEPYALFEEDIVISNGVLDLTPFYSVVREVKSS